MTPHQRKQAAARRVEAATTDLLFFVATYDARASNSEHYHQSKRRDLFEKARECADAMRHLAGLRL